MTELSEAQTGALEQPASDGEAIPAPERDRRDGEPGLQMMQELTAQNGVTEQLKA